MDRVSNDELFSAILSSKILTPYLGQDGELAMLLENPHHCNIHYPQNYASVDQIIPVLKQMLSYMVAKWIYLNRDAAKQLISYGEKYPESQLYDITFNCEKQHYGVVCGQIENELHVVCVLTGDHIPDEMFGMALQ
jgi:hypothetical protein